MFDIGGFELVLIGLIALIVIKPEDLPSVMHTLGKLTGQAAFYFRAARNSLNDLIYESEIKSVKDDIRKDIEREN